MAGFRAVIFDMDGVLADSEPLYLQGINEVLKDFGLAITEEDHNELLGAAVGPTWDFVFEKYSPPAPYDECVARYDQTMVRLLSRPRDPLPGVRELLSELTRRGVPRALASSSWPNWVKALLESTGLDGCFDVTVSSTAVENGKPAPDIFLSTAKALHVEPAQCIVLEDSRTGVLASKAAGMYTIQVRAASTALPPLPEADLVLERLSDFPLSLLD
ncbi:MAG: HAD family phosphatase [Dehalococcoidia bacterium]|nr:HAD family phosphatase [Dehalococcoidia bacterium]